MRRLAEALLLALLLLAVQTAILTHDHGDSRAPTGATTQSCEFCIGNHAAAPAPEQSDAARHAAPPLLLTDLQSASHPPARVPAAHRTRAPPRIHSI